jgi:hypothetical protein
MMSWLDQQLDAIWDWEAIIKLVESIQLLAHQSRRFELDAACPSLAAAGRPRMSLPCVAGWQPLASLPSAQT